MQKVYVGDVIKVDNGTQLFGFPAAFLRGHTTIEQPATVESFSWKQGQHHNPQTC